MSNKKIQEGGLWRNWVGNQSCIVRNKAVPETEADIQEVVSYANQKGLKVRTQGSGHSFTPVVLTSGILLNLEKYRKVINVDDKQMRVTVASGSTINEIGKHLKLAGLSMINQGDIDSQSISGAFCTGTHGTGITLANMASTITGMRIVKSDGSILEIKESDTELLNAARVSLGLFGVISEITIKVMPAYNLHEKLWRDDFDACMEKHDDLVKKHRHFGFFWCANNKSRHYYCLPDTSSVSNTKKDYDVCEMKSIDITDREPYQSEFENIAYSSEIYPIEYVPNFHELEYAVPIKYAKEAATRVRNLMLKKYPDCDYPMEYRLTAGDDGHISPFYKQDSATVSVSGPPGVDYWNYLKEVDDILREFNSRPHWGKLHFLTKDDIEKLYPRIGDFLKYRSQFDPDDMFLNDHLRQLFT